MGEAQVKEFMLSTNRPWSVQLVVDNMQKYGIKKAAVQRHLDSLVSNNTLVYKESGKSKLYMASQENSEELSMEEMKAREEALVEKQRESQELRAKVTALETELRQLSSHVTVAELKENQKKLETEVWGLHRDIITALDELSRKLAAFAGQPRIDPDERKRTAELCGMMISEWASRKKIFDEIFGPMEEHAPNPKKMLKDMGVETDADMKLNLKDYKDLVMPLKSSNKKRGRT